MGQMDACWRAGHGCLVKVYQCRYSVPELDAAEGIAGQLGCGWHAAGVSCLPGGSVKGATVR